MVKHYLDEAISELGELIAITKQDIENIQKADHSHVDDHSKKKTELVRKFEKTKSQLDNELVKLHGQYALEAFLSSQRREGNDHYLA